MKTILHIGTEKTGTKTLQTFLAMNREALRRQRIAFTTSCGPENDRDLATYAIRDDYFEEDHLIELGIHDIAAKGGFKAEVEARLAREIDGLRRSSDMVVFSSEHLQSRLKSTEEIETLRSLLARNGLEVEKVVVYLRRPAEIWQSLYSTSLRSGSTEPAPITPDRPHWNHICDHRQTLEMWGAVFGEGSMVPRLFDRARFVDGQLIADFNSVVGIDLAGLRIPADRNRSLSPKGQDLLRRLNEYVPWSVDSRINPLRRQLVTFIDRRFTGPGQSLSPEFVHACEATFAASDEWVRRRYFPELPDLYGKPDQPAGVTADPIEVEEVVQILADTWNEDSRTINDLKAEVAFRDGVILRSQGKIPEAIDAFRRCLALKDAHTDAQRQLAECLRLTGQVTKAARGEGRPQKRPALPPRLRSVRDWLRTRS